MSTSGRIDGNAAAESRRMPALTTAQHRAMGAAVLGRVLSVRQEGPRTPAPPWAHHIMRRHCELARPELEQALRQRDLPRLAFLYDVVYNKDYRGFTQWLPPLPDDLRGDLARFLMDLQDPETGHFHLGPFAENPLYTVGMPATHDDNVICRIFLFGGAPRFPVACMPRESILQPLSGGTRVSSGRGNSDDGGATADAGR